MSTSSDDDTNSTEESHSEYDSKPPCDVDVHIEDDVDARYGVDVDGYMDMERDSDDEEEEDEGEEDEEEEQEEEENEDEDDGKEPRMIGQGDMANTLADDIGTMVDGQPIVLPEQRQKVREHTSQPQPPVPTPWPQTQQSSPALWTLETHPLTRLVCLGLVMQPKRWPVVPTQREAEAAWNTLDVDVDQQLLRKSAGGDSLPDVHRPNFPLPDFHLSEVGPNPSVGEVWTSSRIADEAMFVAFGLGSSSCLLHFLWCNLFISGIEY